MRRALTNILVTFAVVTSLAAAPQTAVPGKSNSEAKSPIASQAKKQKPRPYQIGKASWYGKFFHGRTTASGEPYDMFLFTAAHRQLPLGTLVKVTNLSNGRSVIVRINDRGPVPQSRIIDLSYGAAQMIDLREEGVEKVRLDRLPNPELSASSVNGAHDAALHSSR